MKKKKITELLIFIVSAELVGALSALITGNFTSIYESMPKPPFSPPGIVFPIVWTILYAVMGISAFFVFTSRQPQYEKSAALKIYAAQLVVNFFWSIIYFRLEMPTAALIDIIVLDMLVVLMVMRFYRLNPISGLMNIPYLIWLAFATYLNVAAVLM